MTVKGARQHLEATSTHELLERGQQLVVVVDVPEPAPVTECWAPFADCLPYVVGFLVPSVPGLNRPLSAFV